MALMEELRNIKNNQIDYDEEYKIVKQFDIGETFKTGSYDRYVVFKNFPESEFVCTMYKMGLIQISCNPFNSNKQNIHLGEITKELLKDDDQIFVLTVIEKYTNIECWQSENKELDLNLKLYFLLLLFF